MTPFSILWSSVIPLSGFNNWILRESEKKVESKNVPTTVMKSSSSDKTKSHKKRSCSFKLKSSSSITMCLSISLGLLVLTICTLEGTDATPASSFQQNLLGPKSSLDFDQVKMKSSRPKFSAKFSAGTLLTTGRPVEIMTRTLRTPSQAHKRAASPFQSSSTSRRNTDFSQGFPNGFTQGLPDFDFTKSMASTSSGRGTENLEQVEETENVGFVHGPPKGFPTLEQLGGKFPNFENRDYTQAQAQESSNYQHQGQINDNDYLSGPGPVSMYNPPIMGRPVSPSLPAYSFRQGPIRGPIIATAASTRVKPHHHLKHPPPPHPGVYPQYYYQVPQMAVAHGTGNHLKHYMYGPKQAAAAAKPVFIKVPNKKIMKQAMKLSHRPQVFFAPSPDVALRPSSGLSSQKVNQYVPAHPRYKRSTQDKNIKVGLPDDKNRTMNITTTSNNNNSFEPPVNKTESKTGDLETDGSEDSYWQVAQQSSPYILFDTYNPHHSHDVVINPRSDDLAISPRNSDGHGSSSNSSAEVHDDAVSGEQRFFPSFPAPSPYLGLGVPFLPQPRPPLFPGPAANRAPSRYYPQFGPGKYTSSLAPPPNRGPSNVFSAESHDHYQDNNLLGSGNFEIVRGGTYYQDDDHGGEYFHPTGHDDGDYYQHHHNGHHQYPGQGQDFFANFRDFADINPPSRSFSHNHETTVEAASSNSNTKISESNQPKNILDKLQSPGESERGHHEFSSSSETDPMIATF